MVRRVSNPPNPWASSHVEWLEEPPEAELEIHEEHAKSILAENDSPDVGFRWSLNPYRGCFHACSYCVSGDTPILMADGRTRAIRELRVGDHILGTVMEGRYRRLRATQVLNHWRSFRTAYRVVLEDGTALIASGDHRFLTERGWKHVAPSPSKQWQRPHLTPNNSLLGVGAFADPPLHDADYREGYLCGMIRGDALPASYDCDGRRRPREQLQTSSRASVGRIREVIAWPDEPSASRSKGFLAGIFDSEGSCSRGVLRISNCDIRIIENVIAALNRFGFDSVTEVRRRENQPAVYNVRVRGGLRQHLRFFHLVDPAITRKRGCEGTAIKFDADLRVRSVEPLGVTLPMFDITTGTGDFIANGVVSHNCYARPSHQWLGFGAGTDFERKLVVKVNAPELLRATFMKPSWKGELIAFSGDTDCYQPLEASYELTRRCLEVCAEFKNPVGLITKSAVIRRDVELLARLARDARLHVTLSIPFAKDDVARSIEPGASSPARRFDTLRILSDAGIPTGVAIAPVIPGLNDSDIPEILERAYAAGARSAFMILVRLPGEVLPVFRERIHQELSPERVRKIEHAIEELRGGGGRMNDSRFGARFRGQGERWRAIESLFELHRRRLGFDDERTEGSVGEGDERSTTFVRPTRQLGLF